MQDGIGRDGYRMLAWVFAGIGVVGLGAGWYAFQSGMMPFTWLGFGLALASLVALVVVNMTVLRPEPAAEAAPAPASSPAAATPAPTSLAARAKETQARPLPPPVTMRKLGAPQPSSRPRVAATPTASNAEAQVEYDDVKPAARAAPTQLVMPRAFEGEAPAGQDNGKPASGTNGGGTATPDALASGKAASGPAPAPASRDPSSWPERRVPSGITLGEMQARAAAQLSVGPATVMAKIWYPQGTVPRGWNRGQCGDCGTQLMAPPQRPIRLRCPHCDKITDMPGSSDA